MRPLNLNRPNFNHLTSSHETKWIIEQLKEIERASQQGDAGEIADAFDVDNVTPTFTLDAATATAGDIANFLGTFINALKNRGVRR